MWPCLILREHQAPLPPADRDEVFPGDVLRRDSVGVEYADGDGEGAAAEGEEPACHDDKIEERPNLMRGR